MKILLHGRLAEAIGPEVAVDAEPGCSIAELRARIAGDHPATSGTLANTRARACVDGTLVQDDYRVSAGQQVEFMPPVCGG